MVAVGTTHNVKIGSGYFLIKPGSYRKMNAPIFGARFTTGDPDYNQLSFWQHWVQSCWIGGIGSETWNDDAMYDEAVGIDTSQHEVMVLSRDLGPNTSRSTGNWNLAGDTSARQFQVFNDILYCLAFGDTTGALPGKLFKFNPATPGWTLIHTFTGDRVRSMCQFAGYLVFGDHGTTLTRMNTSEVFTTFAKPASESGQVPYTMMVYRGRLYVSFANRIWRLKPDYTWDGSTAFYTAEGVNYLNLSEVHLGFLYFISQNGHVLRTDANNTFDMWQFPPNLSSWGLRSYDGKLWVAAADLIDGNGLASEGVLFQFTGSAVTEVKRWGMDGRACTPGKLRVIGHFLMLGATAQGGMGDGSGFGIFTYDAIEDSLSMLAANQDGTTYAPGSYYALQAVDDVVYFGGYIYITVRGYGIFRTLWKHRDLSRFLATYDTTAAGGSTASGNGGFITSSDFDAGTPGLTKLWNAITVEADLPDSSCSVAIDYSTDGGVTWVSAGVATKTGSSTRYRKEIYLLSAAGAVITSPRFKWRLWLRTTNSGFTPAVRSVNVRYLPLPEPNWQWHMTLVVNERQMLLDDTLVDVTPASVISSLESAFRAQVPVYFQDIDGTEWQNVGGTPRPGVLIMSYQKDIRVIGPNSDGDHEGEITLTLMESVEAYG